MVALSEEEAEVIRAAAAKDNMALGAWIGEAAVRSARNGVLPVSSESEAMQTLMVLQGEIADLRRLFRIAGGNLNDVARWANSAEQLHTATGRVMERVDRVSGDALDVMDRCRDALSLVRERLLQERRQRTRKANRTATR
jgi:hypothetical protein